MRVLVTGAEGYIGTRLVPFLIGCGHDVVGLDAGFYSERCIYEDPAAQPARIRHDVRRLTVEDLVGFDAVAHLAELSNDPLGQLNPALTYAINHEGSVRLASNCRDAGIERFVYMSSCSVYGVAADDFRTEDSPTCPQTVYAECKVRVERDVSRLADDEFSPTFLRNATAYGVSPRMRFDLVLNNLAGLAYTTREIRMISDGTPWRPLVHVFDICQAIACTLEAPRDAVHNQVFNIGNTRENFRVKELATIVADVFPGCVLSIGDLAGDSRSYRVSFDKAAAHLPNFACRWTAEAGARELAHLFERAALTAEAFESRHYTRLKQLQHLIATSQLDPELYWT